MIEKNDLSLRILGLQRSGNHAVIRWLISQFPDKNTIFLNNVKHGDYNPILTCDLLEINSIKTTVEESNIKQLRKKLLVYSYEDETKKMANANFISSVFNPDFEKNKNKYIGDSCHEFNVVIIRDPFNFFSSRLKKLHQLTGSSCINTIKSNWLNVAELALGDIKLKHVNNPIIIINYNEWFNNKDYRRYISKKLNGKFSDQSLAQVTKEGGGSSFNGTEYTQMTFKLFWAKKAQLLHSQTYKNITKNFKKLFAQGGQNMKVLERWHTMVNDEIYRDIFSETELIKSSERISKEIAGTRSFVESCQKTHEKNL